MTTEAAVPTPELFAVPRVGAEVATRVVGGDLVMFDKASGALVSLDQVGRSVVGLTNGARTVGEIAETLATEFGAHRDRVRSDVTALFAELGQRGFVTW